MIVAEVTGFNWKLRISSHHEMGFITAFSDNVSKGTFG